MLKRLREQGVRVRILTNSLVSNECPGCVRRLFEVSGKPDRERRGTVRAAAGRGANTSTHVLRHYRWIAAGLHTKAIVFDRKEVFIGSFNLDPRSSFINTEAGLLIESPALAAKVAAHMDEGVQIDNAYRVQMDSSGQLYWVTEVAGKEIRYDEDPLSTLQQRLKAGWIRMLPIEDQL